MNNNFGIFARQEADRKAQEVKNRERSNIQRANRDLRTLAITGKISRFLERSATQNAAINEAVNQIQATQSVPQISFVQSKENDVEPKEPKNFGSTIEVPATETGGTTTPSHPFKITSTQNPDNENQYLVTVAAGTINSLLPTGIFSGVALAQNTIPENSLRYVVLEANSDGEQINTAAVSVESTAPEARTPEIFSLPSQANFLIGLVYNSNVFQVQFTNLSVTGKQQFITSKTNAAVGELPYEIHYVWG